MAPNKVVTPEFISLLTEDQLRLFIEVSILADGHVSKKGNTSIGQSKSERLDALQMAASLLGIWANLSVDLQPDCPSYKGKVVKHSSLCLHKYGGGDLLIGAIKQKKEFYEGVVWCPTTQNKTWLARRKGKIYFTGNSPTALIKTSIKKPADVWEEELLYHHELTNADLIVKLKDIIPEGRRRSSIIWADSERPDCIKEINQAGFNCKPAIKQIKAGIDIVKRMNCHILETSLNIIKEKRAYSWKKDKRGDLTDEPVGWMDHLMDAERYAVHSTVAKLGTGFRLRFI